MSVKSTLLRPRRGPSRAEARQTSPSAVRPDAAHQIRRLPPSLNVITFSRHGAVAALRDRRAAPVAGVARRLCGLLFGSSAIGIAVALLVQAGLGLAPYDVFSSAISRHLGLSLGQSGWLVAGGLFAVATLLRQPPSPWSIAYILANGLAVDAAGGLLTQPETLLGRWTFVAAAIVLMAFGISFVLYSGVSGGPFELLMRAGEQRGLSRIRVRYTLDLGVFGLGILLGGDLGLGTVIYATTFGLAMRAAGQALQDHETGRQLRLAAQSAEHPVT